MIRPAACLLAISALILSIGGCTSVPRDVVTTVPAANYAQTFEAAKATLREYRFVIERVDARAGVITTQAKGTAGLITPWDKEQTTTRQELEELINQEVRTVRVEFIPVGTPEKDPVISARKATLTPADQANADLIDLRDLGQDLQCRVIVAVDRLHRPGRLLSTKTIRGTRNYEDPDLNRRSIAPLSSESLGRDENLEKRLTDEIQKRAQNVSAIPASSASPAPAPSPAPASSAPAQLSPAPAGTQSGFEPLRIEPAGESR
jgi:hypothetical protein